MSISEEDFYIILPSNVKSEQKNTPSHYRTTLSDPLNLLDSDRWEVGLVEVSFVNAIKTIDREEIEIHKANPADAETRESLNLSLNEDNIKLTEAEGRKPVKSLMLLDGAIVCDCEYFTISYSLSINKCVFLWKHIQADRDGVKYVTLTPEVSCILGYKQYFDESRKKLKAIDGDNISRARARINFNNIDNTHVSPYKTSALILRDATNTADRWPAKATGALLPLSDDYVNHFTCIIHRKTELKETLSQSITIPSGYYPTANLLIDAINLSLIHI